MQVLAESKDTRIAELIFTTLTRCRHCFKNFKCTYLFLHDEPIKQVTLICLLNKINGVKSCTTLSIELVLKPRKSAPITTPYTSY